MDDLIASLPVPGRDPLPPYVKFTPDGMNRAEEDRRIKAALLDVKTDTEATVKYVLSSVLHMELRKDGDWSTTVQGRSLFQKKIADFVGSTPLGGKYSAHTYVEVKGISPGNGFNLARLDKTGQEKKLTDVSKTSLVLLALGWWQAYEPPLVIGNKRHWYKKRLVLNIDLILWTDWLRIKTEMPRRTLRSKDRHLLGPCCIYKSSGRWHLQQDHWWFDFIKTAEAKV